MNALCATCRWFRPITQVTRLGQPLGECRRRSPMVMEKDTERGRLVVTRWPQTQPTDFCGHHAAATPSPEGIPA